MTIAATHLTTAANDANQSSYTTASITPTANRLVLAAVANTTGLDPDIPSLSGNGLTWTLVRSAHPAEATDRLSLFRAMGAAPSAGAVTIDLSQVHTTCLWSIVEFEYVDTFSTDPGASAVVQSVASSAYSESPLTCTLGLFEGHEHATAGFMFKAGSATVTPGTGFTELGEAGTTVTASRIQSQWRADNDTTVSWSWSGADTGFGIAAEIRAPAWHVGAVPLGF